MRIETLCEPLQTQPPSPRFGDSQRAYLDREIRVHSSTAKIRLADVHPQVQSMLAALTIPAGPLSQSSTRAAIVDLQQAVVEVLDYLASPPSQRLNARDHSALCSALACARAWMMTLQG